jgi:hypothetical protein
MFYGPKLELWTELSLLPGAHDFQIEDTITNLGGAEQEFEIIYHINFGTPLLGAGARMLGAMKRVFPMNAHAAKDIGAYATYRGPTQDFVEQVYCMEPLADASQQTIVMLANAAGDRAASLTYSVQALPCFTLWKNTNSLAEGYVTGLEPGTNFPYNRRIERQNGRLLKLTPGQSHQCELSFGLHSDKASVSALATRIANLQATHPVKTESNPPPV